MTRDSAARSRMLPTDRRTQILAAARRMLEHKPIDEISVEAVAGEAGVSPGLLFHYFGSQRKFRYAVLQMAAEELLTHVRPDPALSIAGQLRAGVETFVDYVSRFPTIYLAVTRLSRGTDVRELHSSARGAIGGWITDGIESVGVDITPALRLTVNAWLAFVEEAVLGWLARPELTKAELIDMCERGFYHLAKGALGDERRWQEILVLLNRR